jgi:hypothetical protein
MPHQGASLQAALLQAELHLLQSHTLTSDTIQKGSSSGGGELGSIRGIESPRSSLRGSPPLEDDDNDASTTKAPEQSRLVLIIDDAHNADKHSCELLSELARRSPDYMLLLTACKESDGSLAVNERDNPNRDFAEGNRLVHSLALHRGTTTVRLQPLSTSTCERLACSMLRATSLPTEVLRLLHKRSGGCPLLIGVRFGIVRTESQCIEKVQICCGK